MLSRVHLLQSGHVKRGHEGQQARLLVLMTGQSRRCIRPAPWSANPSFAEKTRGQNSTAQCANDNKAGGHAMFRVCVSQEISKKVLLTLQKLRFQSSLESRIYVSLWRMCSPAAAKYRLFAMRTAAGKRRRAAGKDSCRPRNTRNNRSDLLSGLPRDVHHVK